MAGRDEFCISEILRLERSPSERQMAEIRELLVGVDSIIRCRPRGVRYDRLKRNPVRVRVADFAYRQYAGLALIDVHGVYHWRVDPPEIVIKEGASSAQLTFLHELGHLLDDLVLHPGCAFVSRLCDTNATRVMPVGFWNGMSTDVWEAWLFWFKRVTESVEVRRIAESGAKYPELAGLAQEFRSPQELWARSFAQYIAENLGSGVLQKQLDEFRKPEDIFPRHWSSSRFVEIGAAVHRIFEAMEWLQ